MKLIKTRMMNKYLIKLVIRVTLFLSVLTLYLYDKDLMIRLAYQPLHMGITFLHILWAIFMFMMIKHLFVKSDFTMALLKSKKSTFKEVENYNRSALLEYVQKQNFRAWVVMLVWLIGNGMVGILYSVDLLDKADLFMLTVFYFLCDYICILFYCPFQSHIMKNKCCVNCRIFEWGHFMMFTPMIFIKSFYSWSLFFTSCIVLIHWELIYAKHPERFYSGSNQRLQCQYCKDKTCQIKNRITKRKPSQ